MSSVGRTSNLCVLQFMHWTVYSYMDVYRLIIKSTIMTSVCSVSVKIASSLCLRNIPTSEILRENILSNLLGFVKHSQSHLKIRW